MANGGLLMIMETYGENTPVKVSNLSNVTAVAGGGYHSLAMKSDGTVWAWGGSDYYGQLGNGTTKSPSPTPVQVASLSSVLPSRVEWITAWH